MSFAQRKMPDFLGDCNLSYGLVAGQNPGGI
jgi:hypothetical protein